MLDEIDPVRWESVRLSYGIGGQRIGQQGETVSGQCMRYDEDAMMGAVSIEILNREANEIIAVASD
jgi:methyl coenzyme M reductase gamma subunit